MHVVALVIFALVMGQPQSQLVGFAPSAAACEAARPEIAAKVIAGAAADKEVQGVAVVCVPVDLAAPV